MLQKKKKKTIIVVIIKNKVMLTRVGSLSNAGKVPLHASPESTFHPHCLSGCITEALSSQ